MRPGPGLKYQAGVDASRNSLGKPRPTRGYLLDTVRFY